MSPCFCRQIIFHPLQRSIGALPHNPHPIIAVGMVVRVFHPVQRFTQVLPAGQSFQGHRYFITVLPRVEKLERKKETFMSVLQINKDILPKKHIICEA